VFACAVAVVAMGGLSYAAVPLYRLYCQATGFGGATQRAEKLSEVVLDRVITVRFDANVGPGLPWRFEPVQQTVDVKVGENVLAFFRATNLSDQPIKGMATFNVAPDVAGLYFSKIECFCFKEQRLDSGETVEMPVSFFVDPSIMKDRDADVVRDITLSYTFYPVNASPNPVVTEAGRERRQGG
jgi:cytochrome c oxidase assembly protein subunit 11